MIANDRIEQALSARLPLLAEPHGGAWRLFNGYSEGLPGLVVEVFATTLVIFDHTPPSLSPNLPTGDSGRGTQNIDRKGSGGEGEPKPVKTRELPPHFSEERKNGEGWGGVESWGVVAPLSRVAHWYRQRLPWLNSALLKTRADPAGRNGALLWGEHPARRIEEAGVRYALDLTINQDASFYLDTRNLRAWLRKHSEGKTVLNTFAYTGSLGAACLASGALRVVQTDLDRRFLNLAKDTYALNGWPVDRRDFLQGDFFRVTGGMRHAGQRFDLAILDPPFFSTTHAGRVDLASAPARLINKLRPLVRNGGYLVTVNNALYLSGTDYLAALEELSADGYLDIEELIPVPEDVVGYGQPVLPADPTPFNHPTKIAVLKIKRKVPGS